MVQDVLGTLWLLLASSREAALNNVNVSGTWRVDVVPEFVPALPLPAGVLPLREAV